MLVLVKKSDGDTRELTQVKNYKVEGGTVVVNHYENGTLKRATFEDARILHTEN